MHIPAYLAKLLLPILWSCEDNLRNAKEIAGRLQDLGAFVGVNVPTQLLLRPPLTPLPIAPFQLSPGPSVQAPIIP